MIPPLAQKMSVLLSPASSTAAATRSANVDCLGVDHVTLLVPLAIELNTNAIGPTIAITEADTTAATSFATWSSSFSIAGVADQLVAAKQYRFDIDTKSRKRYLNIAITTATATNDHITSSVLAIYSRRESSPAGTAGMVGSTSDTVVVG